jgi:hypothetical protein
MYAGGTDDGIAARTAATLLLGTASPYSGGANDGQGSITQAALSLITSSSYSGGANDGASAIVVSMLPLASASMYAGGTNDGFNGLSVSALSLGAPGSYSGGSNDGASALLSPSVNLSASGMYAGGSNDGTVNIRVNGLAMYLDASMYAGGGDDGFSRITAPGLSIALPIMWEDFTLTRQGADAYLHWQVGNERDDIGFEIQRSYDGGSFSKIDFVPAMKGISSLHEYGYTDVDPASACPAGECGQVYYRLKQIALSGSYSFSPIRKLTLDPPSLEASVYPNPATDKIVVRINAAKGRTPIYSLGLYNSIGVVVFSRTMMSQPIMEIDVREYPSGTYYLRLSINELTYPYRITITH